MKTANMRLGRSSPTKPGAALERALLDTSSDRRLEALKRTEQELKEARDSITVQGGNAVITYN